jgi:hypothetical protein
MVSKGKQLGIFDKNKYSELYILLYQRFEENSIIIHQNGYVSNHLIKISLKIISIVNVFIKEKQKLASLGN